MAGATNIPDLTPEEHKSLDQWASDIKDLDPNKAFDALGYSPGFGGYRTHEELTPGFWDNALARAGILTDKMRERQELSQKQQALLPFVKELMDEKIRLRHIMALTPGTDQDVPAEVARTLNLNQPQPFAQGGTAPSMAAPTGLQPAPNLQPSFGAEQPPMMLRPAPSAGDQAMAAMPLGTPGQIGALSNTAPFAAPPMQGEPPLPFSPLETTGYQNVPEYDPMTGGYRPGLQTVALREGPPMVTETVRDQPMVMADKKVIPPPLPAPAPQELPLWRRKQVSDMMTAQATGHLVRDDATGTLIPISQRLQEGKNISPQEFAAEEAIAEQEQAKLEIQSLRRQGLPIPGDLVALANAPMPFPAGGLPQAAISSGRKTALDRSKAMEERRTNMPEIVKLQAQADKLPPGERRDELEQRIRRLSSEGGRNLATSLESLAMTESKRKYGQSMNFSQLADRDPDLAAQLRQQAEVDEPRRLYEFQQGELGKRQLALAGPMAEAGARATNQVKTESSLAPGVMILEKVNKLVDTPGLFLDENAGTGKNLKHMAELRYQYFKDSNSALREWAQIEDGMRASLARMTGEVGNLAATEQERAKMLLPDLYGSIYGVPDSKQIAKKKIALFGEFMKTELEAAQGPDVQSRVQAKLNEVLARLDQEVPLPPIGELSTDEEELAKSMKSQGLDKRMVHMEILKRRNHR